MPNRCYIYATNRDADGVAPMSGPPCIGASEHSHEIPLVFKILASVNPRPCLSRNWILEEPILVAVVGEFDGGVKRLMEFLKRIESPALAEMKAQATEFLGREANRRKCFRLEPFEIFWLNDDSPESQMERLLNEISDLGRHMDAALARLERKRVAPLPRGFFARLFQSAPLPPPKPLEPVEWGYSIGLGYWQNALCFMPFDG